MPTNSQITALVQELHSKHAIRYVSGTADHPAVIFVKPKARDALAEFGLKASTPTNADLYPGIPFNSFAGCIEVKALKQVAEALAGPETAASVTQELNTIFRGKESHKDKHHDSENAVESFQFKRNGRVFGGKVGHFASQNPSRKTQATVKEDAIILPTAEEHDPVQETWITLTSALANGQLRFIADESGQPASLHATKHAHNQFFAAGIASSRMNPDAAETKELNRDYNLKDYPFTVNKEWLLERLVPTYGEEKILALFTQEHALPLKQRGPKSANGWTKAMQDETLLDKIGGRNAGK